MKAKAAVVIPYFHTDLTMTERISLDRCRKVLGKYPIIFLVPITMVFDRETICERFIRVPDEWMSSVDSYNQMMLSKEFYELFSEYEYILIYQLDAYVFSDKLEEFCNYGFDYIGAPWLEGKFDITHEENGLIYVGNGGFSLRRVKACLLQLSNDSENIIDYNEDLFWGSRNSQEFKVASVDVAMRFAFERPVRVLYERNGFELPFGCHAWMKYDFDFYRNYMVADGYYELEDAFFPWNYDKNNSYVCKKFMLANNQQIMNCIKKILGREPGNIYIYGAGIYGEICGFLLKKIIDKPVFYLDRSKMKVGNRIYNILVKDADKYKPLAGDFVIISVEKNDEIINFLECQGLKIQKNMITFKEFIKLLNEMVPDF